MRAQQRYRVRVVGGDADATVAWTILSKHYPSARRQRYGGATAFLPSRLRTRGLDDLVQALLVSGDALRRQSGCDDIPVVAEPVSKTLQVAWTILSKRCLLARTLYDAKNGVAPVLLVGGDALRRQEWRRTCVVRRQDADATVAWTILSKRCLSVRTLYDAKKGVAPAARRQEKRRTLSARRRETHCAPLPLRRRGAVSEGITP